MNTLRNTAADFAWWLDWNPARRLLELLGILTLLAALPILLWLVLALCEIAGCGAGILGVPMLVLARSAWVRRPR